ncbi:hypothetical protein OG216_35990 [Streptomycetaceae bacterium NBC_01309]
MAEIQEQRRVPVPLSGKNKVGLVLAGILGVLDVVGVFGPPGGEADDPGPPLGVLIATGVLGVITLVAVVYAWRTANRTGSRIAAASRILSAITSLPAFFIGGMPAVVVFLVAVFVIVTAVATALILSRPAPDSAAAESATR